MAGEVQLTIVAIDAASNIIKGITDKFGPLGVVATGAIGAATGALTTMITKGSEAEDVQARFNSLVDASPLKDYKDKLIEMANAYSLKTRYEDESIMTAESQLAIYTNIGKDAIPEVLKQTLNLAAFMKSDAPAAATIMGRALQDIAGGSLMMLTRQRLLTKEQADSAKQMAETGNVAGAQAMVLDALDKKIGTLAEDMGGSFAGRMQIFQNFMENIAEDAGMKLLPALEPVLTKLMELATKVAPVIVEWIGGKVVPIIEMLVNGVLKLTEMKPPEQLVSIFNALKVAAAELGEKFKPLDDELAEKFGKFWSEHGDQIIRIINEMADGFVKFLPILVDIVGALLDFSVTVIGVFMDFIGLYLDAVTRWHDFWQGMRDSVDKFVRPILDAVQSVKDAIASVGDWFGGNNGVVTTTSTYRPPGRAGGGPVSAGGMYLVGERGPEIVRLGSAGNVVPNSAIGGQAIYQFNFPGYIGSTSDLEAAMRGAVRRMQLDRSL